MKLPAFGTAGAIFWGAIIAGLLDIAAVFAFWAAKGVSPIAILQSIASALLGPAAFDLGGPAALLGLFLHFAVSFTFAAAYVLAAVRVPALRVRYVLFGLGYGFGAHLVMSFIVVPLTRANFGSWPPPLLNYAASLFIHLVLFGLPIAWAASRMRR